MKMMKILTQNNLILDILVNPDHVVSVHHEPTDDAVYITMDTQNLVYKSAEPWQATVARLT